MAKTVLKTVTTIEAENKIIKIIEGMSGKYSAYTIFTDWIKMYALAIQNSVDKICCKDNNKTWQDREEQYKDTARKYTKEELLKFCEMNHLLLMAFEENGISDYLGDIYMRSGAGNKSTGQFFTPFNPSLLSATVGIPDVIGDKITLNEPSCGGGGMILATAQILHGKGINYQRVLDVVAQDLDWNAIYMSYVQLSLTGISAKVVQGNTLLELDTRDAPSARVFRTPMKMGVIL